MKVYPAELPKQLDFDFIRQNLAARATNPRAKEALLGLETLSDESAIHERLQQVNEMLGFLLSAESLPGATYVDIEKALRLFNTQGTQLEEKQFYDIRSVTQTYNELYQKIQLKKERLVKIYGLLVNHWPNPEVVKLIDAIIDEKGEVRSNASPELAQIRKELVHARAAADRIFARMVKRYRDKGLLADFDESVSENRRVLAIQAAYKGQANGILHGSSSKQSIVYLEPAETVEVNNQVTQLQVDERNEIRRILRELTAACRPHADWLTRCCYLLDEYDFLRAIALYAYAEEAVVPNINNQQELRLRDAYNPVLRAFNKQRNKETIPLSLELSGTQRILVISGPNAGGKSLALKTLGLLQYMLQCGIPVPVHPTSDMFLFGSLFADIGDAQSIENELSTYSSKLQKMRHFLTHADDQTLLLIDEFGTGSDPDLGSALAQTFLKTLNTYKCYGILTTHYNAIKALAADEQGIENGAMLFDGRTLEPQYQLQIGNPGSSYTFQVAHKQGIPPHLIKDAKGRVDQNVLQTDKLLSEIQGDKIHLNKIKQRQEKQLRELNKLKAEQQRTIAQLEEKLEKQSRINEESDRILYWGQRFEKFVEGWMNQQSQKDKKEIIRRFIGMLNQRSSEVEVEEKKSFSKAQSKRDKQINALKEAEVKVGDQIKILENNLKGTVTAIKNEKYTVAIGNLTSVLDREKFIPVKGDLPNAPKRINRKKKFNKPKEEKKNPGKNQKTSGSK